MTEQSADYERWPLRDWGADRFLALDRFALEKLHLAIGGRTVIGATKRNLAGAVFANAHLFGTATLGEVLAQGDGSTNPDDSL